MLLGFLGRLNGRFQHSLARLLRELTDAIEQSEAGAPPPTPDVLAARLRDQLGREPTRAEMLALLTVVEGLASALTLTEPPTVRRLLESYADGLRRDLTA